LEIECDNKRDIPMDIIPTYNSKNKHIDVKYHFVRKVDPYVMKLGKCENQRIIQWMD
jgi:hypothetical protein